MGLAAFNRMRRQQAEKKVEKSVEEVKEQETTEEVVEATTLDLESMSVKELRDSAKEYSIKGYHLMKKETLIEELQKILG